MKNHQSTTLYKRNSGCSGKIKVCAFLNFCGGGQVIVLKSATAFILDRSLVIGKFLGFIKAQKQ